METDASLYDGIEPGQKWKHYTGRLYTVLYIANTGNDNPNYPVSIVFEGSNGNVWVKTLDNFREKMTHYPTV